MLVGAAADRWNVDPADCETADGFVMNRGRTFTFGELAEEAADRTPPLNPPLRQDQGASDRPATAAPRRTGEGRRQLAICGRCAPARKCSMPGSVSRLRAAGCKAIRRNAIASVPGSGTSQRGKAGWPSLPRHGGRLSEAFKRPTRSSRRSNTLGHARRVRASPWIRRLGELVQPRRL